MSVIEVPRRVFSRTKKTAIPFYRKRRKKIHVIKQGIAAPVSPSSSPTHHPLAEVIGYLKGETWHEIRLEREQERLEREKSVALD